MAAKKKIWSARQFRAWLKEMDYDGPTIAASELGVARNSVTAWSKRGAPPYIKLAAEALTRRKQDAAGQITVESSQVISP